MSFFPTPPPPFAHQTVTTNFIVENKRVFDMSDPGTGKTRAALDAISEFQKKGLTPVLVLAPKAILEPAWANDIQTFTPHLKHAVAYAKNRAKAFQQDADIYITNHDAVSWMLKNLDKLPDFKGVFVDESTAFKHHTSGRSKALRQLLKKLDPEIRVMMSGTPSANDPLHIWHQVLLIDDGEHLGTNFYQFRKTVCEPVPAPYIPSGMKWQPRDDAEEAIAEVLEDITVRHEFEKCVDIPANRERTLTYVLSPAIKEAYNDMAKQAYLELKTGEVSAVNAAVMYGKLLQIASGAVYLGEDKYEVIDTSRYELITELIEEREKCVVAFQWTHQKEQLIKHLTKAKIKFAVIDGKTKDTERNQIVFDYQHGTTQVILAHPQSAGHGLTLTAGTTTIWASPTSNAELFIQFNRRIYRAGQKRKTETIVISAEDTIEPGVFNRLTGRVLNQRTLLDTLRTELAKHE